jgi:LuxR family maltose regulon positive regulatory protein
MTRQRIAHSAMRTHELAEPLFRSREPHSRSSGSLLDPLSVRELEVLHLIAIGDSNYEIAEQLVVAVSTVKRHVSNIFSKLGVTNRTQAVARAREFGIL